MKKSTLFRVLQILAGLFFLWVVIALFVSWSETNRFAQLAKEKNELLLQEQLNVQKLKLALDSCRTNSSSQ